MPTKRTPTEPGPLVIEHVDPATLTPHPKNPRTITASARAALRRGIEQFGLVDPLVVQRSTRTVLGGHQRLSVAQEIGLPTVPVVWTDIKDADADTLLILLNNPNAQGAWDHGLLSSMLQDMQALDSDLSLTGFDEEDLTRLLADVDGAIGTGTAAAGGTPGALAARFGVPPFSVMNAREGWWQDRKRAWLALGIQSELGRGDGGRTWGQDLMRGEHVVGGANATPGGSLMPEMTNYSKNKARGDGRGRPL